MNHLMGCNDTYFNSKYLDNKLVFISSNALKRLRYTKSLIFALNGSLILNNSAMAFD